MNKLWNRNRHKCNWYHGRLQNLFQKTNPNFISNTPSYRMKPTITIQYCPKCNWLLRAAYMAQEFLTTFLDDIAAVTLKPSEISGQFSIYVNELQVFDRKAHGGFPEITFLKQLIRDQVNPAKQLGHSDKKKSTELL